MTAHTQSPCVFLWHDIDMVTKKCVVLDLDNTLWGGIIGEDGIDGVRLSHDGEGAGYMAFQQALRDLYDRGILLAINSRNTEGEALAVIDNHPNMILKRKHFAASRINWNDKVENMRELADELRIGLDSMVFLDDDPVNRSAMRALLPHVETPELPTDPAEYASFLLSLPYFPAAAITDEDKMRGNLYVTERLRMESEKAFENRDEFLNSLKLKMEVYEDDDSAAERLAQLSEKTNQFNIDKRPLTVDEIKRLAESDTHKIFYGRVTDRFGDYGIVAFALVATTGSVWHIGSLLMSCRVLMRGVEDAFLAAIAERAKTSGARGITIGFVPSDRNKPAQDFVERVFTEKELPIWRIENPSHIVTSIIS